MDSEDLVMPSEIFRESDFWSLESKVNLCLLSSRARPRSFDD